jgi:uncharacterized protein YybS (DUF2232 family)
MLLPDNINPNLSLYYNGSFVLQTLMAQPEISLIDLYIETRKLQDMTMPVFVLSLDWLYIVDLIDFNQRGKIIACF